MTVADAPSRLRAALPALGPSGAPAVLGREHEPGRLSELAVLAFFLLLYANAPVVLTQVHGVPPPIAWSIVLLPAIPIVRFMLVERRPLPITPVLPFFLLFLGALALSAVFTGEPVTARKALSPYLTEGLLFFLIVTASVRTPRTLKRVVWMLLLAGALLGTLSIYQEFTHSYANELGGFARVDRLGQGGGFNIASSDLAPKDLRPRLGGPLGSENRYAQMLVVLVPIALIFALRERSLKNRLLAVIAGLLILGGVLLTFSRGGAVALGLVVVAMLVFRAVRVRHVAAIVAIAAAIVLAVVPSYVVRLTSLQGVTTLQSGQSSTADNALRGRETENLAALYTFADHPLVGVGPGVYFRDYSRRYANKLGLRYLDSQRRAHSLYLELLADAGLIGLGAFLAVVGVALGGLRRVARGWRARQPELALVAEGLFFALLAYMAAGLFLQLSYQRYFWLLVALASSTIWVAGRMPEGSGPASHERRAST